MAIIKKSTNNKGWRECGEKWTLLHCWWKWKVIQPLWRMVWKFLLKARNKTTMCLIAQLCLALCDPMDCSPPGSCVHEDSPGKNTGVGCHTLLQGIFLTQGSNPGLLHCRQILYCLGHQGSPYDPAVPLLGAHTEETTTLKDTCTPGFIAALFTTARTWM